MSTTFIYPHPCPENRQPSLSICSCADYCCIVRRLKLWCIHTAVWYAADNAANSDLSAAASLALLCVRFPYIYIYSLSLCTLHVLRQRRKEKKKYSVVSDPVGANWYLLRLSAFYLDGWRLRLLVARARAEFVCVCISAWVEFRKCAGACKRCVFVLKMPVTATAGLLPNDPLISLCVCVWHTYFFDAIIGLAVICSSRCVIRRKNLVGFGRHVLLLRNNKTIY